MLPSRLKLEKTGRRLSGQAGAFHTSQLCFLSHEWALKEKASCVTVCSIFTFTWDLKEPSRAFSGGQWLRLHFQCRGHGFNPWSGN